MFAKSIAHFDAERPTLPCTPEPAAPSAPSRTHLMLVREPSLTPRGLVWAQAKLPFDGRDLQRLLLLERLNLG